MSLIPRAEPDQDMAAGNIEPQNPRIEEMDNPMDNSNRSINNSSTNRSNQNQSKEWLDVKLNIIKHSSNLLRYVLLLHENKVS